MGNYSDSCEAVDDLFFILNNSRRRIVIRYLESNAPASTGELAEIIAAEEQQVQKDNIATQKRKTALTSLLQTHLKPLVDLDIIEWTDSTVKQGSRYDRCKAVLDCADRIS